MNKEFIYNKKEDNSSKDIPVNNNSRDAKSKAQMVSLSLVNEKTNKNSTNTNSTIPTNPSNTSNKANKNILNSKLYSFRQIAKFKFKTTKNSPEKGFILSNGLLKVDKDLKSSTNINNNENPPSNNPNIINLNKKDQDKKSPNLIMKKKISKNQNKQRVKPNCLNVTNPVNNQNNNSENNNPMQNSGSNINTNTNTNTNTNNNNDVVANNASNHLNNNIFVNYTNSINSNKARSSNNNKIGKHQQSLSKNQIENTNSTTSHLGNVNNNNLNCNNNNKDCNANVVGGNNNLNSNSNSNLINNARLFLQLKKSKITYSIPFSSQSSRKTSAGKKFVTISKNADGRGNNKKEEQINKENQLADVNNNNNNAHQNKKNLALNNIASHQHLSSQKVKGNETNGNSNSNSNNNNASNNLNCNNINLKISRQNKLNKNNYNPTNSNKCNNSINCNTLNEQKNSLSIGTNVNTNNLVKHYNVTTKNSPNHFQINFIKNHIQRIKKTHKQVKNITNSNQIGQKEAGPKNISKGNNECVKTIRNTNGSNENKRKTENMNNVNSNNVNNDSNANLNNNIDLINYNSNPNPPMECINNFCGNTNSENVNVYVYNSNSNSNNININENKYCKSQSHSLGKKLTNNLSEKEGINNNINLNANSNNVNQNINNVPEHKKIISTKLKNQSSNLATYNLDTIENKNIHLNHNASNSIAENSKKKKSENIPINSKTKHNSKSKMLKNVLGNKNINVMNLKKDKKFNEKIPNDPHSNNINNINKIKKIPNIANNNIQSTDSNNYINFLSEKINKKIKNKLLNTEGNTNINNINQNFNINLNININNNINSVNQNKEKQGINYNYNCVTEFNSNNIVLSNQEKTTNKNNDGLLDTSTYSDKSHLIKEGNYYIHESNKLSTYIKNYYEKTNTYPETKINFYKFGRLIGRGAFGKVNLGLHVLTGKIVAIKSFNLQKLIKEESKIKIIQEVNLMKNLKHNSIVKILETVQTDKYYLIVMENIAGGDLLNYIKKRIKLPEKIAKILFLQLIKSIKYLHSQKIIHRDIKLDNILIDLNNNIKLCDFGISKKLKSPNEILKDPCGTPAYIAPEILVNDTGYEGYPVDIWSSGVVLYAMLSGTVPFKANNPKDLHSQIIKGSFKEINDISKEATSLLHSLLETNPKKRITIEQILVHPWLSGNDLIGNSISNAINEFSLFTKAEIILLSKTNVDYRLGNKEDMIENFTLKNLFTDNDKEAKNVNTKSNLLAPFSSSVSDANKNYNESELQIENSNIKYNTKTKVLNRNYELNNNGEIDHGIVINLSKENKQEEEGNKIDDNISNVNKDNLAKNIEKSIKISVNNTQNDKENKKMKEGKYSSSKNIYKGINNSINENYFFDDHILTVLEKLGYDKEYVKDCISNNKLNYATSAYYLLDKYK